MLKVETLTKLDKDKKKEKKNLLRTLIHLKEQKKTAYKWEASSIEMNQRNSITKICIQVLYSRILLSLSLSLYIYIYIYIIVAWLDFLYFSGGFYAYIVSFDFFYISSSSG